jgi:hypothetical protein
MSRSGYTECSEDHEARWQQIRWRGAVHAAIFGKRGQAFLKELLAALDALPEKKLIAHQLVDLSGNVCALGAVAKARGLDVSNLDPQNQYAVAGSARSSESDGFSTQFLRSTNPLRHPRTFKSLRYE